MNPKKTFIKNLVGGELSNFWICGKISQNVGTDILIIDDGTAKAKITDCDNARGQNPPDWICKGSNCCIIGVLMKNTGLPEIRARKIMPLDEDSYDIWKYEVQDLELYLSEVIEPDI